MRYAALVLTLLFTGCADEPGACIESARSNSVRIGWCLEADRPSQCPAAESGDEAEDWAWRFESGVSCFDEGFEFDCGDGIFEDIESECPASE
ncbi:MAG: hypothetical protein GWP91_07675 [Rhodobacterales bacterium]|nr:hypothetical protein [Rhodobacterales bacterium]